MPPKNKRRAEEPKAPINKRRKSDSKPKIRKSGGSEEFEVKKVQRGSESTMMYGLRTSDIRDKQVDTTCWVTWGELRLHWRSPEVEKVETSGNDQSLVIELDTSPSDDATSIQSRRASVTSQLDLSSVGEGELQVGEMEENHSPKPHRSSEGIEPRVGTCDDLERAGVHQIDHRIVDCSMIDGVDDSKPGERDHLSQNKIRSKNPQIIRNEEFCGHPAFWVAESPSRQTPSVLDAQEGKSCDANGVEVENPINESTLESENNPSKDNETSTTTDAKKHNECPKQSRFDTIRGPQTTLPFLPRSAFTVGMMSARSVDPFKDFRDRRHSIQLVEEDFSQRRKRSNVEADNRKADVTTPATRRSRRGSRSTDDSLSLSSNRRTLRGSLVRETEMSSDSSLRGSNLSSVKLRQTPYRRSSPFPPEDEMNEIVVILDEHESSSSDETPLMTDVMGDGTEDILNREDHSIDCLIPNSATLSILPSCEPPSTWREENSSEGRQSSSDHPNPSHSTLTSILQHS